MRKKSFIILIVFLVAFSLIAFQGCKKQKENSYVTMEINPSIELVVNAKGEITQANGVNDDGKMLVINSELVGKNINAAAELIIDDCIETGYIYSGAADLKISLSWTSSKDSAAESSLKKLKKAVDNKLAEVGVDMTVETLEAKKDNLKAQAKEYDPTLTEEELNGMDYKTLMSYASLNILEKSKLPTVELEEYYQTMKEYEFEFKKREAIVERLTGLDAIFKERYTIALNSLKEIINSLMKVKEKYFLNVDSDYNKAIAALEEKKDEKRVIQIKLSLNINDTEKEAELTADLEIINTAIEVAISALNTIKETVIFAIDRAVADINDIMEVIDNFDIYKDVDYNAVLDSVRDEINGTKNNFLTNFEDSFKWAIEDHNERISLRQSKIKESIASAKQ